MKTIPFKTQFKAAAFAGLLFLAAGCEKEVPVKAVESTDMLPTASFTKQISVGAQNRANASFVVEVGASDQRLLDALKPEMFAVEFNPAAKDEPEVADHLHEAPSDGIARPFPVGQKVVTVHVLGAYSEQALERYSLNFSDAFQAMVSDSSIALCIKLRPSEEIPANTNKVAGYWWRTSWTAKIKVHGRYYDHQYSYVDVYKAYPVGSVWYQGLLHSNLGFDNYSFCSRCRHSGTWFIDDVWVRSGIVTDVDPYPNC